MHQELHTPARASFASPEFGGPTARPQPIRGTRQSHLTPRQKEVLAQLSTGLSNKIIATTMGISPATVKVHLSAILRVLGAANRTQAVLIAQSLGGPQSARP